MSRAAEPVRNVHRGARATVVTLAGEVDLYNAHLLRAALEDECRRGPERLVVDLSGVESLDATAVHVLASARKRLRDWHALVLVGTPAAVVRTIDATGLLKILDVRVGDADVV